MQDELTKKLIEYLDGTKDFILQQAPDIIQQTLRYKLISSWMGVIFPSIVILVCAFISIKSFFSTERDKYDSRSTTNILGLFVPFALACPMIGILCSNVDEIIKIKTAPKYYLLQLLKDK